MQYKRKYTGIIKEIILLIIMVISVIELVDIVDNYSNLLEGNNVSLVVSSNAINNEENSVVIGQGSVSGEEDSIADRQERIVVEEENLEVEEDSLAGREDRIVIEEECVMNEEECLVVEEGSVAVEEDNLVVKEEFVVGEEDSIVGEEDNVNIEEEYISEENVESSNITNKFIVNKKISEIIDDYGKGIGEYEISIDVAKNSADIVFLIDTSFSLRPYTNRDKWNLVVRKEFEELARKLLNMVIDGNKIKTRIGIVGVLGGYTTIGSIDNAYVINDFTNDLNEVISALRGVNKFGTGNVTWVDPLNMEAGLLKAREMLKNSDVAKYVVIFTDGPPTQSIGEAYSSELGSDNANFNKFKEATISAKNLLQDDGVKIIAIGEKYEVNLFLYSKTTYSNAQNNEIVKRNMIEVLSEVTNINLPTGDFYENRFFIANPGTRVGTVFTNTYNSIEAIIAKDKNNTIENINVVDTVPDEFVVIEDAYGQGINSIIVDNTGEMEYIIDSKNNEINWENKIIDNGGFTIKYKIKPIDDYLIKDDIFADIISRIEVNESGKIKSKEITNPILNIRRIAEINLTCNTNEVNTNDDISEEDKCDLNIIMKNVSDNYEAKLIGNEKNTFTLINKCQESDREDLLQIGTYIISSVNVSDEYEVLDISVNGVKTDLQGESNLESREVKFNIDKDNNNIDIKINLKKVKKPVLGNLYIESSLVDNDLDSMDNNNEVYIVFENNSGNERYGFRGTVDSISEEEIYLIEEYSNLPKDIDYSLSYIKAGNYKIKQVLPMNIILSGVYVKNDRNGQWQNFSLDNSIEFSEDNKEIFIKFEYKVNNGMYWYKRVKGK